MLTDLRRYWGKRDVALNLPTNSSISVTLSQDDLHAHTTASCSQIFKEDEIILNGHLTVINSAGRLQTCLTELRSLREALEDKDSGAPRIVSWKLRIVSKNNFPTAAGLASSAAGFAALVRAVANLYELAQSPTELSMIARQGSGSACRSLLGGYVAWDMGKKEDGSDSLARVIAPRSHWAEMEALILVVSADKKDTSSTEGMQATVKTSRLYQIRTGIAVPQAMIDMETAILAKDFESFASITMKESNSFHATCLDTTPPIFYMNDVSRLAIRAVEELNKKAGRAVAAYTFDAGPNPVLYYLAKDERLVSLGELVKALEIQGELLTQGITKVIRTRVGDGPRSTNNHLVNEAGEPDTSSPQKHA